MSTARNAGDVLDREFLQARSRILELAATLDRIDRAPAPHTHHADIRMAQLRQGIESLLEPGPGRAETVQMLFSLEYDPGWRASPTRDA